MVSKKTYEEVWCAMDACNSSGVIHALNRWVDEVWQEARELNLGTDYVNSHPIIVIVCDKLLQLARIASGNSREESSAMVGDAYNKVIDHLYKEGILPYKD